MMLTPAVLTCSWSADDLGDRTTHLCVAEDGMEQAEALVQEALHKPPSSSFITPLTNTTAAPWLQLVVGSCGIVALCVVANARVLEIHEISTEEIINKDDAESTLLLTQEAQLVDAATGLYAHFLCHGSGGALFPSHHCYRLKLFARNPRQEVCVATVCLVRLQTNESTPSAPQISPEVPSPAAAATANTAILEVVLGLQRHLFGVERRVHDALDDVVRRLSRLECRVDRLETPAADTVASTTSDGVTTLLIEANSGVCGDGGDDVKEEAKHSA
jgi:hypothetical protein